MAQPLQYELRQKSKEVNKALMEKYFSLLTNDLNKAAENGLREFIVENPPGTLRSYLKEFCDTNQLGLDKYLTQPNGVDTVKITW